RFGEIVLVPVVAALKIEPQRLAALGRLPGYLRGDPNPQRVADSPADLVLHGKDIRQLTLVSLGPQPVARIHGDKLRRDSQPLTCGADAPLYDVFHVQCRADRLQIGVSSAEAK